MEKYILKLHFWVPTNQQPVYLIKLNRLLRVYFLGPFDKCDFEPQLKAIDSFINEFQFIHRKTNHNGSIIKRTIKNNTMDIFSLTGSSVLLTVSFIPDPLSKFNPK